MTSPVGQRAVGQFPMPAVLDAVPSLVMLLDAAGTVTYANSTALDVCGNTLAEVLGEPFWRSPWWAVASAEEVRTATLRCAAGDAGRVSVDMRIQSSARITVELDLTPIRDDTGRVSGMVACVADAGYLLSQREVSDTAQVHEAARLRAERMFQLARALTGANDIETILQRTSRIGGELVGAAFANIGLVDPTRSEIELMHSAGLDPEIGKRWPRVALDRSTPIGSAMLSGSAVELGCQDAIFEQFPVGAADATAAGFHALAAYPVRRGRAAMGFAWTHPIEFDDDLRHLLGTVVDLVGLGLDRAESSARHRQIADQLQRGLLPLHLPAVPGATVGALYESGTSGLEVGGDWYDVVSTSDGRYVLGLGDVVGHGLQAASAMGQLRTAFAALATTMPLDDLVERLSHFAIGVPGARFSTVAVAEYTPSTGALRVVLAGHVPPLMRRHDGTVEQLPDGGPPLGIDVGATRRNVVERSLGPGDSMVMYSDGLIERRGESIDVGLRRLAAALASTSASSGQIVVDAMFDALGRPRSDDVAVVGLVRDTMR